MFEPLAIPGVILIKPKRHGDARGWFSETFRADTYVEGGIHDEFVQENHSLSTGKGTIRGLHFQIPPKAQAKLVRCTRGSILDVAVDLRTSSPTYAQSVTAQLSAENGDQLYIPKGFAHGFCTLSEEAEVQYKVSAYYAPEEERGIAWDDSSLKIDWGLDGAAPILSSKDAKLPTLAELPDFF